MTSRGPFQPQPFCDSVIVKDTAINLEAKLEGIQISYLKQVVMISVCTVHQAVVWNTSSESLFSTSSDPKKTEIINTNISRNRS